MKRGIQPGLLIGIVFVFSAVLFAFLISVTLKKPATTTPTVSSGLSPSSAPRAVPLPTIPVDTIAKAPGTTTYSLDSLNDIQFTTAPTAPLPIAGDASVTLRGWAVDVPNGASAGGVIVSVDTANYQAIYGVDRPDVASVLKNPAYTKSGFNITFPPNTLSPGRHAIAIKILTNDRTAYYQPDQKIDIEIGQALGTLMKRDGTTTYSIDSLNDTQFTTAPTAPLPIAADASITLRGWAVDAAANTVAGGVIVSIDGTMDLQAVYGVDRSDVASLLKNPAYAKSGFNVTFPASKLSHGKHAITIKILTNDRTGYYQPDQEVDIEIA